jgi:hypothetical protein
MPLDPQLFPAGNVDRNATLVRPTAVLCSMQPNASRSLLAVPSLTVSFHAAPQIPAANLLHTGESITTLVVSRRPCSLQQPRALIMLPSLLFPAAGAATDHRCRCPAVVVPPAAHPEQAVWARHRRHHHQLARLLHDALRPRCAPQRMPHAAASARCRSPGCPCDHAAAVPGGLTSPPPGVTAAGLPWPATVATNIYDLSWLYNIT